MDGEEPRRYDRRKLLYPSDLTDEEWPHVERLIPPAKRGGNKRHVEVREVMNGIMFSRSCGLFLLGWGLPFRSVEMPRLTQISRTVMVPLEQAHRRRRLGWRCRFELRRSI